MENMLMHNYGTVFFKYVFLNINNASRDKYTVNPALLTSSFVWLIQLWLLHISLFKEIIRKYFSQGKYELMNFLFVLLDKLKIFTL
jgi:hypothetical protein